MKTEQSIETRVRRLIRYIEDMEKGLIQIPAFQRDFIWTNNDRKDLFDSLKNGYPIGSIIFWKPLKHLDVYYMDEQKIGAYSVPSKKEESVYILDGFQRLSTILGCLINPNKTALEFDNKILYDKFILFYDLKEEEFFIPRNTKTEVYQIPVYELIDTKAGFRFQRNLMSQNYSETEIDLYTERYERLGTTLIDYQLPSIDIIGGEIEEIVKIFSRINSKGTLISPDWMISALSNQKDFRLGTEIDELIEELKNFNFSEIKREILLQCITNSFGKVHFDQFTRRNTRKIEDLVKRSDFIEVTNRTIISIKKAVKFLFEELLVVDYKLLPYSNQLIFITDFFNQIENPAPEQLLKLKDWFWLTTYANYFTVYSLSKQREAYNHFQKFLRNEEEHPFYNDSPDIPFDVAEFPEKIFFGSVRAKSLLLFMLNYANNFKKVDYNNVFGMNVSYLFYNYKNEDGNYFPETVVPFLAVQQEKLRKTKDMSYLITDYTDDYKKFFITKEMQGLYKDRHGIKEVIQLRKNLIIENEKQFIKKWQNHLQYPI